MKKRTIPFLLVYLLFITSVSAEEKLEYHPTLINKARSTLSHTGILRQHRNGLVYVEISDEYIHKLAPLVGEKNTTKPPYFNSKGVGAHISVINAQDVKSHRINFQDEGRKIYFKIEGFYSSAVNWPKFKRVYYLTLSCPELEKLRCHYGLSPLNKGHKFHITIAVLPRKTE